jgi:hypothetical protein
VYINEWLAGSFYDATFSAGQLGVITHKPGSGGATTCDFSSSYIWEPETDVRAGGRLAPGTLAYINTTGGDTLNLRSGPGLDWDIWEELRDGTPVTVLDGPREGDGYTWWIVRTPGGTDGFVVERVGDIRTLVPAGE